MVRARDPGGDDASASAARIAADSRHADEERAMGTGSESREETLGGLTRRVTMFRGQKRGAQTRVARVARSMHQCCYTYKREYRTLPRVGARASVACLILAEREAGYRASSSPARRAKG